MADRHLVEPRTCRSGSSNRASLQLFRVLHLKGALFFALFQFQKKVTTGVAARSSRIRMGLSGSRLFRRLFLFRSRCLDACSGLRLLHFRGGLSTVIGAVCHRGCNRQSEDSGSHEYDFHVCLPIIWVWHCSGEFSRADPSCRITSSPQCHLPYFRHDFVGPSPQVLVGRSHGLLRKNASGAKIAPVHGSALI